MKNREQDISEPSYINGCPMNVASIESGEREGECNVFIKDDVLIARLFDGTEEKAPYLEQDLFSGFEEITHALKERDLYIMVCCQCPHFGFSGLAYDMSAGSSGYCAIINQSENNENHVVSIFSSCSAFSYRKRHTDSSPYLPP